MVIRRRRRRAFIRTFVLASPVAALVLMMPVAASSAARLQNRATYNPLTYSGPSSQSKLLAAAEKEGSVTFYTSLSADVLTAIQRAWSKKYPSITLNLSHNSQTQTILQQQESAHDVSIDVLNTNLSTLLYSRLGLIEPYYTNEPTLYKISARQGLTWGATSNEDIVDFAYNTKLLPASAVPKTLKDLTKPALKGKMSIEVETDGSPLDLVGAIESYYGKKNGLALIKQLGNQNMAVWGGSTTALEEAMAAGTVVSSPVAFSDTIFTLESLGSPIRFVPLQPGTSNPFTYAVAKSAPHPAAGLLLVDWLLSRPVQAIFSHYGYFTLSTKLPAAQQAQIAPIKKPWTLTKTCPTPYDEQQCTTNYDNLEEQYWKNA